MNNVLISVVPLLPNLVLLYLLPYTEMKSCLLKTGVLCILCYGLTDHLIPVIGQHTLKRGLSGKDLGKKGSIYESRDVPEALGLVPATCFLITAILTQMLFANNDSNSMMLWNAALFSICFMTFLGFCDDTLDLAWRYKLILPPLASLPLLSAYSGETALFVPTAFRWLLMDQSNLKDITLLSKFLNLIMTVDTEAGGAIVELGSLFLVFMGLLAVFCTNSINILAGINGLECGQSYVIACSVLFFKLYDLYISSSDSIDGGVNMSTNPSLFTAILVMPFIGASLALLKHNWFPATVFVGDTFCYFAGMTFAVLGILGHFSKTLLLLFLPQLINFVYSLPQLFKIVPCPRHRLPQVCKSEPPDTNGVSLLEYSRFPCKKNEYRWLKTSPDATHCPNLTIICIMLRITGPISERTLCIYLLAVQIITTIIAFYVRYILLQDA